VMIDARSDLWSTSRRVLLKGAATLTALAVPTAAIGTGIVGNRSAMSRLPYRRQRSGWRVGRIRRASRAELFDGRGGLCDCVERVYPTRFPINSALPSPAGLFLSGMSPACDSYI
jgi:hypothetical protein